MNVLAFNRGDAASYYRVVAPFSVLRKSESLPVAFSSRLRFEDVPEHTALWLHMSVGSDAELVAREFQRQGKPVVYDVDDWIFEYPPSWSSYDNYFRRGRGPTSLIQSHIRLLQLADVVTTTTDYLAAKLGEYNPNVRVLPNGVIQGDWDTILPKTHGLDGPVIGWFGTGNHWEEWYEIAPALDEALEAIGGYLALLGAPELLACFPERLAARTYLVPLTAMRDFGVMRQTITSFNVGIAWATSRLEASKCRSPLKAIQYAAAGVPVLKSHVVYGDVLSHDLTFASPQELAAGLVDLHGDAPAWGGGRERARVWQERVWEDYTYETQAEKWMEVLKSL